MENENAARMKVVRIGLVLSLLTILFGFGLGGVFGAAEKKVKGHLKAQGRKFLILFTKKADALLLLTLLEIVKKRTTLI